MNVYRCVEIGHRIGVIPSHRSHQASETLPVGASPELLFIEIGEVGIEGEDLIVLFSPLIASSAGWELEFLGMKPLWEASLWRHMIYRRRGIEATAEETERMLSQKLFSSFFPQLVFLSYLSHVSCILHGEVFGTIRPASTMVVAALVNPKWRVEIEAEAVLP
jgi:hypothetical protein